MRCQAALSTLGLLVLVAGCSDDTTTTKLDGHVGDGRVADGRTADGQVADGPLTQDGTPPVDSATGATTGPLTCQGYTTPAFSKVCMTKNDCVAVTHMVDCCGTMVSFGIASSDKATFDSEEQTCAATYPACGCAAQPTKTEDGSLLGVGGPGTTAAVDCVAGVCRTYVGACGKACSGGSTCQSCAIAVPTTYYSVCSTDCTTNADCKDATLPECVDDGIGAGFCAASGSGCTPK